MIRAGCLRKSRMARLYADIDDLEQHMHEATDEKDCPTTAEVFWIGLLDRS